MTPHIAILGGGPAGCGAAWKLRHDGKADVTLLERQERFGGNAGSFHFGGQWVDYGSHRLHHACDEAILADLRTLLDGDLASRERHGRIRLRGRWLHFPLRGKDLMLRLDRRFALGASRDMVARLLPGGRSDGPASFASVLRESLGPTICEGFYFPYARKIWGREPDRLSPVQARKRVSSSSFGRLLRRVLSPPGGGFFYYPREGYGQISVALARVAETLGASMRLGTEVTALTPPGADDGPWQVEIAGPDGAETIRADHVWSTLPITLVARMMRGAEADEVAEAAAGIDYRSMVLVYIRLGVDRFSTTDAHYFPEAQFAATRISEPKNYYGEPEPAGSTVLCAEIPCSPDDDVWSRDDDELAKMVVADLERAGLDVPGPVLETTSRRLRFAYPIYDLGYASTLERLDRWAASLPRFLTYGRQGLFAHDNTHHALAMAWAATDCLGPVDFDASRWAGYREVFETHVVED